MALTISIVTPALNQGRFIEETICSVLLQEGDFFIDYIIMDGGSTDETISVIQKYEKLLLEKRWPVKCNGITYRWTSESDRGQGHAINKGFAIAAGEILAWLNSDDIYLPGTFNRLTAVDWKKSSFCYGEGVWMAENGTLLFNYPTFHPNRYSLYVKCILCQPTVFFTANAFRRLGNLSESYQLVLDYEYWLRAVFAAEHFVKMSGLSACSRMYPKNKSFSSGRLGEWEALNLKNEYYQYTSLNYFGVKIYKIIIETITKIKENSLFKKMKEAIANEYTF